MSDFRKPITPARLAEIAELHGPPAPFGNGGSLYPGISDHHYKQWSALHLAVDELLAEVERLTKERDQAVQNHAVLAALLPRTRKLAAQRNRLDAALLAIRPAEGEHSGACNNASDRFLISRFPCEDCLERARIDAARGVTR